jgi:D-glycero-D-manno-heptose 1,7-bisphosphate phosphatase
VGVGGGCAALKPAVFFDRDGVLNAAVVRDRRPYPPASVDELQLDPGAAPCIRGLRARGFCIIVVTNQPDVARGTTTREMVQAINERVRAELVVDDIYTCFHDRADGCACRKPRPGMLYEAAREHDIDLAASYLVGDRWTDIAAGRDARCRTVWIERDYDEPLPDRPDARFRSLTAACDWIIDDCNA